MAFPDDQPDGCPSDARRYKGQYFRFQSGNLKRIEAPQNHIPPVKRKNFPGDPKECGSWGLSGYLSEEQLEEARVKMAETNPQAVKWPIMIYDLTENDGEIKHTPLPVSSDHHDLWLYKDVSFETRAHG